MIRNPGKKALKAADIRETPRSLFDKLNQEFRFTLDAAATHGNALCSRYCTLEGYFDGVHKEPRGPGSCGLTTSWAGDRVWCNPPFSELETWTSKAWAEFERALLVVMLVPANRTDRPWWQKNVAPYVKKPGFDVRWRDQRDRFTVDGGKPILNAQGKLGSPSFACALLIWS
jgi:phage N-6-adenine-methyltransferase